jgi:hypothetical protein
MSYITVEDINTILLKWGGGVIPSYTVHEVPEITVTDDLYRGNSNPIDEFISLPETVEFTVYFENRPVESVDLPRDYGDTCRLRVVTKSYYPYVDIDVFIDVPVVTKHLTTLEDLNKYSYGYIAGLREIDGEINNNIYIKCRTSGGGNTSLVDECNFVINGDVTFDGGILFYASKITNNGRLEFKNAGIFRAYGGGGNDYCIVNHFELYMKDITRLDIDQPFVLNSNYFAMENNIVSITNLQSVPAIYNTGEMVILNNSFTFNKHGLEYDNFAVCLFRSDKIDVDKLLIDNGIIYDNITATIEETTYNITGTGICYAKIDDDTIYIKNLEVTEYV